MSQQNNGEMPVPTVAEKFALQETLKRTVSTLQPDMVDKFGTKWYLDKAGSTYASAVDNHGVTLGDGATVWLLEEMNQTFKMCLVIDQKVCFEGFTVQQVGQAIDHLRARKRAGLAYK